MTQYITNTEVCFNHVGALRVHVLVNRAESLAIHVWKNHI